MAEPQRLPQQFSAAQDNVELIQYPTDAGFEVIDGSAPRSGYDDGSEVDIVAVPCPGAHPVETWCQEPLPNAYAFDLHAGRNLSSKPTITELSGGVILSPGINRHLPKRANDWIRHELRRHSPQARVAFYRHRIFDDSVGLEVLADDLLEHVSRLRQGVPGARPLFFVGHSIGGLVIKKALVKARRNTQYEILSRSCYGITFFATPHRGSSYLSADESAGFVQQLLNLGQPLPGRLRSEISLNVKDLLCLNSEFVKMSWDFRIWTFYETRDSVIATDNDDVDSFAESCPLVSLKSSLLGTRHEAVFSLDCHHTNCGSFGQNNDGILRTYLEDLSRLIEKSVTLSQQFKHAPLDLGSHVKITITGFFASQASREGVSLQSYVSKYFLDEFLKKGPEQCLDEMLSASRGLRTPEINEGPKSPGVGQTMQLSGGLTVNSPASKSSVTTETPLGCIHDRSSDNNAAQSPDSRNRKYMWIHLAFTNPHWVEQILQLIGKSYNINPSKIYNHDSWTRSFVVGRHASQPAYIRPGCGFLSSESPEPRSTGTFYLYLPYLNFDTYQNMVRRRLLLQRRIQRGRAIPVPPLIAEEQSLEFRVNWEFLQYDPPINMRRTLDQFGYPALADTSVEDDDQMLYKLRKDLSAAKGNVLMVDQLWLWAINSDILTTFFPRRESKPLEGTLHNQANLRNSVFAELNGDLAGRCDNSFDLAALIASHAVTVLLDRTSHPDLEVFTIFEEALEMLGSIKTSLLKRLRAPSPGNGGVYSKLADTTIPENETLQRRRDRELQIATEFTRVNTSALIELADMGDELGTLKELFDTQETILQEMLKDYRNPELQLLTRNGQVYLRDALARLEDYKSETADMLARINTTRMDYEKVLKMVQRQAQVDDARMQTELASSQYLSVTIFTIFTVIFLPLSFFTGLFGMNTAEWDDNFPTLGFIGAVALPASFLLITVSLVAALNERVQEFLRRLFRVVFGLLGDVAQNVFVWAQTRTKPRVERIRSVMTEEKDDFWETQRMKTWERRHASSDYM